MQVGNRLFFYEMQNLRLLWMKLLFFKQYSIRRDQFLSFLSVWGSPTMMRRHLARVMITFSLCKNIKNDIKYVN